MNISEHYTQYCFQYILDNYMDDLEELNKFMSKGIIDKLKTFCSKNYIRITYDDAIKIIVKNIDFFIPVAFLVLLSFFLQLDN